MNKVEIIPAILPQSFKDLESHVAQLHGVARRVQVDVVDGRYAHAPGWSGKTWPYKDAVSFEKLVQEEHGLPHWDEIDYQFDLMITDPLPEVARYVSAGATQLVLHAASDSAPAALQSLVERRDEMGTFAIQLGVALGAEASPDDLALFEGQFDFVQVMGIDREGKQGQPFDKKSLTLLERLRTRYPLMPLQVDGAVTLDTCQALVAAGANRLIAGHAIFGAHDPVAAYKELYNKANAERYDDSRAGA